MRRGRRAEDAAEDRGVLYFFDPSPFISDLVVAPESVSGLTERTSTMLGPFGASRPLFRQFVANRAPMSRDQKRKVRERLRHDDLVLDLLVKSGVKFPALVSFWNSLIVARIMG